MRRFLAIFATLLVCAGPLAAASPDASSTYDLLFRNGTLDQIDRQNVLVYSRDVTNRLKPEAAERDTGDIALSFGSGTKEMAELQFRQDDKHRGLGRFPASVGNPIIMFFYESVLRDMAEATGGSPHYIRNRVKEALVQPGELDTAEAVIGGQTAQVRIIRLFPFRDDPNQDRMQGFGALELRVTVSDAVPGWYVSLIAEAPGGEGDAPVYRSVLTFERLEAAQ